VARLAPLTDTDAAVMIDGLRPGQAGSVAGGTGPLADLLARVSRLADDLPDVAELDLGPVRGGPDGLAAARARLLAAPAMPADPFLRRLR
jgi:hypothetical protein